MLMLTLWLTACDSSKIDLGGGPELDARFVADLATWSCDLNGTTWEGAFDFNLRLQHAPDALPALELPASGCNSGVDLFPQDAGASGANIDGAAPSWESNDDYAGDLTGAGGGYYAAQAFANQRTCGYIEDVISEGVTLSNAGPFSGASTPAVEDFSNISITGAEIDPTTGIPFGAEATVSWEFGNWDETWVQIRREQGGSLVEAATCNTTGESSLLLDNDVWGLLHDVVAADVTNIYVGAQSTENVQTENGEEIELLTRIMHVAIIND